MDPLLKSLLDDSEVVDENTTEEVPTNPFPPKESVALRDTFFKGKVLEEVGGAAEAALTLGSAAISTIAGIPGGLSGAISEATKILTGGSPNIQKAYEDTSNYVENFFPVYEPKTKFGKDTTLGAAAVLENVDLWARDKVAQGVDMVTKLEGTIREKITGEPFKVSPESDALNKALGYAVTNLVGLNEIARLVRSGVKITGEVKQGLLDKGLSQRLVEEASVQSDIFHNLNFNNAKVKLGIDDRAVPEAVADALQARDTYKLSDKGIEWQEHLTQRGVSYKDTQESLKSLYESTSDLVEVNEAYAPKYKDISDRDITHLEGVVQAAKEEITPPYFMQNRNPIVKRIFDLARDTKHRIDVTTEELLFGTTFKKGFLKTGKLEDLQLGISTLSGSATKTSKEGFIYNYSLLGEKSRARVINTLVTMSEAKLDKNSVRGYLKQNLTTEELKAANDLMDLPETLLQRYNSAARTMGKTEIREPTWLYLPRPISGPWSLRIYSPDGKTTFHKGFSTEYTANKYARENFDLNKLGKDGYKVGRKDPDILPEDALFNSFLRYASGEEAPLSETAKAFLDTVSKNRSYIAARKARRTSWADGYDYDPKFLKSDKELTLAFEKAILNNTRAMVRATEQMSSDKLFNEIITHPGVQEHYPNSVRLGSDFRNKVLGKRTSYNEGIDKIATAMSTLVDRGTLGKVSPEFLDKFANKAQSVVTTTKLLVYSPGYLYANTIQPYIVAANYGAILQSRGLQNNTFTSIIKAEKALHIKASPEERDVMNYYMKEGRIATAGFFRQFSFEESSGEMAVARPGIKEKLVGVPSGKKLAIKIDQYTRAKAGLIYYHQLRDAGVSHEDAKITSGYLANHTMVDYSRAEKANIYDSKAGGVLGKFQSWAVNALAQNIQVYQELNRQMRNNIITNPEAARNIGKLFAAKGFETLAIGAAAGFGVQYVDSLLKMSGADYSLTETMNDNLPDWALFGAPQAAAGIQLPSLGSPDILGFSTAIPSFYTELLEATKGIENDYNSWHTFAIKRALGSVEGNESLLPKPEEISRFYKAWLPKSSHAFIDSWVATGNPMFWELDENKLYPLASAKHKGVVLQNVSKNTFMKQMLGGMPIDEKRKLIDSLRIYRVNQKAATEYEALVKSTAYLVEQGIPIPSAWQSKAQDLRAIPSKFKKDVDNEIEKGLIKATWRMFTSGTLSSNAARYADEMFKKNPNWVKEMEDEVSRTDFGTKQILNEQLRGLGGEQRLQMLLKDSEVEE